MCSLSIFIAFLFESAQRIVMEANVEWLVINVVDQDMYLVFVLLATKMLLVIECCASRVESLVIERLIVPRSQKTHEGGHELLR